jgi:hypothetical protein
MGTPGENLAVYPSTPAPIFNTSTNSSGNANMHASVYLQQRQEVSPRPRSRTQETILPCQQADA